jgi:hypothetical protein
LFNSLSVSKAVSDLAAVPAIGALFGALFQLARDSLAHERSLRLEEGKNSFTVGATSHMADVAFDKHVQFCEEYTAELYRALSTLFRMGPNKAVLEHASKLPEIRRKWAVWVTPELEAELVKFEDALCEIGADAWLVGEVPGEAASISRMFSRFAEVVGLPAWRGKVITKDLAITTAVTKLRQVLGTAELTQLRSELIKRAAENLKNSS